MPSINLPFDGFYESFYSSEIDTILEREAEWLVERQEEEGVHAELRLDESEFAELLSDNHNHRECCELIAKTYTDAFDQVVSDAIDLPLGLKFEELTSPRYYNFETDRIFAEVSDEVVASLFAKVSRETLRKTIEERFTSYDGFASHYSNDIYDWLAKPITDWDHNELGTLLLAVIADSDIEDLRWDVYYAVVDCDGLYNEVHQSLDWKEFEENVAERRQDKLEAYEEEHGEPLLEPPYRCPETPDLFASQ
jgi:hypothetical protein